MQQQANLDTGQASLLMASKARLPLTGILLTFSFGAASC